MTDDQTRRRGTDPEPSGPDSAETQLRKVLAMTNGLEPPRDDLFAQRALQRGRARTARRRNVVFGAAAAVLAVGALGGTWALVTRGASSSQSASSAGGEARMESDSGSTALGNGPTSQALGVPTLPTPALGSPSVPSMPPAREPSVFFGTLTTPATTTFDAVAPTVAGRWPGVFAGAYADDPTGTRVVVTVTRDDSDLEAYVRSVMPTDSVRFELATYTWAEKVQVAERVRADAQEWATDGVRILAVQVDSRSDRVVVTADEGTERGAVARRYGEVVRVVAATAAPTLPNGATLPTLQP
jgi:hypothetical protein